MSRENPTAGKPFCKPLGRSAFRDPAGDDSAAAPRCGTRGAGGGLRGPGRLALGFEGVFVAGIDGSHPQGTRERKEDRLGEEELDRVSGSSPVWTRR